MKKIAWIISRIFDPMFEMPLILIMSIWYAVDEPLRIVVLIFVLMIDIVVPGGFAIYSLKAKKASDLDFTKKEERKVVYLVTVICQLLVFVTMLLSKQLLLAKILAVLLLIAFVFMMINNYWKISVHAAVNAVLMAMLNYYWGWKIMGGLMVILIAVLWARVKIRKHTVTQVMMGAGLALAMVHYGFSWLGI